MPEGPLGFPRLTNIGPLTESTSSGVEPPSFKTKTFRWDKVDMRFESAGGGMQIRNAIESPGGRGVERGSSFSLDGTYIDKVGADEYPAVTFIYPLDKQEDIPFFYINPFGKHPTTIDGRSVVLESANFFEEAEVAVQAQIDPSEAEGVLLTVDEDDVDDRREEKLQDIENNPDAEKYGWKDSAIERTKRDAEFAKKQIGRIKDNFKLVRSVPKTEFRKKVWEIDQKWDGFRGIRQSEEWHDIVSATEPIHRAVAETYDIDYDAVVERERQKMEDEGAL